MSNRPMTFTKPASLRKIERILALLAERPMTTNELAPLVPISAAWARIYIQHLHETRRIYISTWVRHVEGSDRMYPRAVYRAGQFRDSPKPAPLTYEERLKRAWHVVKSDPERHQKTNARRRARNLKPRPNPLTLWITP